MNTPNRETRFSKKKRSKLRIVLYILLTIFLLFIGTAAYAYWNYKSALKSASTGTNTVSEPVEFNGVENKFGKINVLLLGIDSRGEEHSRTDTIMVAQYDQDTKKSKLVSIMRDSYVDIPGYDEKNKINAAYSFGGPELLRKTLKENFDIDVQYYALIDFNGFAKVIDEVFPEGVQIDVEKKMSHGLGLTLQPGQQMLHGKELLGYVRFRYDAISDFGRIQRQQKVLQILSDKLTSAAGIMKIPSMIGTVQPYIDTNLPKSLLFSVASSFLGEKERNIETLRIPENNGFTNGRVKIYGQESDVLVLSPENLQKNTVALDQFLNN
ncbi:LCP family protein [Falsibacillus pallidus]|uniref:LCP family protein n=1 Tax=Falsibacillus pallidus TaxID=493781 RepID=UPI003D985462